MHQYRDLRDENNVLWQTSTNVCVEPAVFMILPMRQRLSAKLQSHNPEDGVSILATVRTLNISKAYSIIIT